MQTMALRFRWPMEWLDFAAPRSRSAWTVVGAAAVPLWATWPTLAVTAAAFPPFQLLAIAFAVGWLLLTAVERRGPRVATDRAPFGSRVVSYLACALGLSGSNAFFILATAHISPAQANLISFLWPVMVVALGAAVGLFRLVPMHIVALALGFAGAAFTIGLGEEPLAWSGVTLAALSGLSWAAFCLFRLRQGAGAQDVLAGGCGFSAVICGALHLALETTVLVPGIAALLAAVGIGIAPLALANLAWDHGIRRGDSRSLAVMAYATPLCSALLLIALGLAQASTALFVGAALIMGAGFLSSDPGPSKGS